MAIGPVVSGGNMTYAFRSTRQIEALAETGSLTVVGIINRDRLASIFLNNGETRYIGRPISHVDHIRKRNWANIIGHVVVQVLRQVEYTFVDSKRIFRLLSVADASFRKNDSTI